MFRPTLTALRPLVSRAAPAAPAVRRFAHAPPSPLSISRQLHASAIRHHISNYNLGGMRPATEAEAEDFQEKTPAGFGRSHGVATTVRPLAYDTIPPVNDRGGRDVRGWRTVYEGTVAANWANTHGTMHGACAAWLTDNLTGRATEALGTPQWWGTPPVSITLDMTYFSPARIGDKVTILVTVERIAGSVAHTRCDIFHAASGERVASGTHVLMWKKPKGK